MSQHFLLDNNRLRAEVANLFLELGKDTKEDAKGAVISLISQCRKTLDKMQDDGLGPWEIHELEFAHYLASTHDLLKPALIWAYAALEIYEPSTAMCGSWFYSCLA
ncbi:MAG: hypothetical protein JWQ21_3895 [Herminiimonas sp.]|nr:hypothetical protein [Herminiimonas sp.]